MGVIGIASLAATGILRARAQSDSLPDITAAALVSAVRTNPTTGFSGTVVSQLELGLPELSVVKGADADDNTSLAALLSGSHTLQMWYGGPDKQRIALLGATDETDLFRNGRELWEWSSENRVAVHTLLPAGETRSPVAPIITPTPSAMTPTEIAGNALASIDRSTTVSVDKDREVAHRSAYELVLTPRSMSTRVGSVRIDVDGATKVPLGVRVYARGSQDPAVDVAFSSIRFAAPAASDFSFSPPADATVREVDLSDPNSPHSFATDEVPHGSTKPAPAQQRVSVTGSGWSSVMVYRGVASSSVAKAIRAAALTRVSGSWGKGRLFDAQLLCILMTSDGRVYAGAVPPPTLYAAATK